MTKYLDEINPPGQGQITYRAGTYAQFLERMELLIRKTTLPGEKEPFINRLKHLDLNANNDLATGILKSWAVIGDILSFYQERIANEGYIRTATERKSLVQLVQEIGYTLKPGLSAETFLAFTAVEKKAAAQPLLVPAGTVVQGIPGQSLKPVTFETSETIEAKPQWNKINAYIPYKPKKQTITPHTREFLIAEVNSGLKPGEHVLVTGKPGDTNGSESLRQFHTLKTVEPLLDTTQKPIGTRLQLSAEPGETLSDTNGAGDHETTLQNPRIYAFKQKSVLFGSNAPQWETLPPTLKQQTGTPRGGIFYSTTDGNTWHPASGGLPETPVRTLGIDQEGRIFVGTGKGIYRSQDNGQTWKPVNTGITRKDIHTLFIDHNDHIYAGASMGGAYRSADHGESWEPVQDGLVVDKEHWKALSTRPPNTVIHAIISYREPSSGDSYTIAGTTNGIMRIVNGKSLWEPSNEGLPGKNEHSGQAGVIIKSLAFYHDSSHIFAGTDQGLFRSKNHGKSWHQVEKGLTGKSINALVYCKKILPSKHNNGHEKFQDYMIAGTENGIFWSNDNGHSWTPAESGLNPVINATTPQPGNLSTAGTAATQKNTVTVLTAYTDVKDRRANIFAGTGQGVFISVDYGQTWQAVDRDIQTNTANKQNKITAMAANLHGTLSVATPSLGVIETQWPDFHIQGNQVDLLRARPGILPGTFMVLKQDSPQKRIQTYTVLNVSSLLRTDYNRTAKVTRIMVTPSDGLEQFDLRDTQVFLHSQELPLLEELIPAPEEMKGDTIKLAGNLEDLPRGQAIIIKEETKIKPQQTGTHNSAQSTPPVAVRRIAGTRLAPDGTYTEILLEAPLENSFNPELVTVCANVAAATHGETISHEIMGNGDASKANQEFILKKAPLTYISAAQSSGEKSTLQVRITSGSPHGYLNESDTAETIQEKGIPWNETNSLYGSGPVSQEYMVRIDENDKAHVIFGDGEKGTRLPTGIENITATYRSGGGEIGNVKEDTLIILKSRILGIRKVTNPVPATGGTENQSILNARTNAPANVRTLQRIVSMSDYQDFVTQFAGIAKAEVTQLWNGTRKVIHITAAGSEGAAVTKYSALYNNLITAIQHNRAISVPLQVDSYVPLFFNIEAAISLQSQADPEEVKKQIYLQINTAYDFNSGEIGNEISISGITALLQEVKGVKAVDVRALYLANSPKTRANVLQANTAYWDVKAGKIQPAQLLMINRAPEGITLITEGQQ